MKVGSSRNNKKDATPIKEEDYEDDEDWELSQQKVPSATKYKEESDQKMRDMKKQLNK